MTRNYLESMLPFAFTELALSLSELQGIRFHSESMFLNEIDRVEKSKISLIGTTLLCEDITGPLDNGWEMRAPVESPYFAQKSNHKELVERIIPWNSSFIILQALENTEHFFEKIARTIDQIYPDLIDLTTRTKNANQKTAFLSKFRSGSCTNRIYFYFLTEHIFEFSESLKSNYKNENFVEYLEVLRFLRNRIGHAKFRFWENDKHFLNLLKDVPNAKQILLNNFSVQDVACRFDLKISSKVASDIINTLINISFQCFKQISLHYNIYNKTRLYIHFKPPQSRQLPPL